MTTLKTGKPEGSQLLAPGSFSTCNFAFSKQVQFPGSRLREGVSVSSITNRMQQVTVVADLLLQGKAHLSAIKLAVQAGLLLPGGNRADKEGPKRLCTLLPLRFPRTS